MSITEDKRRFKRTKDQEIPTNPTVTPNTGERTSNLDLDKTTVKEKQNKN